MFRNFQASPIAVVFLCSCDKVYHKQKTYVCFFCIYKVRLSPDNITLIHWINIGHVLLQMIMIDSCGSVHW